MEYLRWILLFAGIGVVGFLYWRGTQGSRNGAAKRKEPRIAAHKKHKARDREPDFDDWSLDHDPISDNPPPMSAVDVAPEPEITFTSNADDKHSIATDIISDDNAAPNATASGVGTKTEQEDLEPRLRKAQQNRRQSNETKVKAAEAEKKAPSVSEDAPNVEKKPAQPDQIIMLHVKAKSESGFKGSDLKRVFSALEMEFGEMKIYHRYPGDDKSLGPIFSVANMFEPGTFDEETMDQMVTPGFTMFTQLPGPVEDVVAFDDMVACADYLSRDLGGEILDEAHQPLSMVRAKSRRDIILQSSASRGTSSASL